MAQFLRCFEICFLITLSVSFLTSCQNTPPLGMNKRNQVLFKSAPITMPEPNHYQVSLRWAPAVLKDTRAEEKTWMIYRGLESQPPSPYLTLKEGQTEAVDPTVTAGKTYTYVLGFLEGSDLIKKETTTFTVPKDLVITETVRANSLTEYKRIFLKEKGIIETQGERLELSADELHSYGGVIQTYGEENLAPLGLDGRTPEILVLQVKRAFGNLTIKAIGQNGGKGVTGEKGSKGATGRDGGTARSQRRLFGGGRDGIGGEQTVCVTEADEAYGKRGGQGNQGGLGGKGGNGGNSPKVYIRIDESSELEIKIDKIAGKKGEGGNGGPGGDGGDGGKPGTGDIAGACPAPKQGEVGPIGPEGPTGPLGLDGLTNSPECIKTPSGQEGSCSQFIEKNGFVL